MSTLTSGRQSLDSQQEVWLSQTHSLSFASLLSVCFHMIHLHRCLEEPCQSRQHLSARSYLPCSCGPATWILISNSSIVTNCMDNLLGSVSSSVN